ncbi:hypothetical protein DNK49_05665 [Azoarcus communis]|uniref:Uncharacterized protein n=1 Tax=Parazoarcus communis SWub3 = DSM 12120 TaxID=1121029 RepID=A0A323UWI2_9RHOO|nr:hypothetical protein DNK49_05665 [Azoarcus communis] [Parazoarcus communis SWub3 = DSM 12120]
MLDCLQIRYQVGGIGAKSSKCAAGGIFQHALLHPVVYGLPRRQGALSRLRQTRPQPLAGLVALVLALELLARGVSGPHSSMQW